SGKQLQKSDTVLYGLTTDLFSCVFGLRGYVAISNSGCDERSYAHIYVGQSFTYGIQKLSRGISAHVFQLEKKSCFQVRVIFLKIKLKYPSNLMNEKVIPNVIERNNLLNGVVLYNDVHYDDHLNDVLLNDVHVNDDHYDVLQNDLHVHVHYSALLTYVSIHLNANGIILVLLPILDSISSGLFRDVLTDIFETDDYCDEVPEYDPGIIGIFEFLIYYSTFSFFFKLKTSLINSTAFEGFVYHKIVTENADMISNTTFDKQNTILASIFNPILPIELKAFRGVRIRLAIPSDPVTHKYTPPN
ncbi:MAG: hypothetical protein EZS28_049530, partial [Streblomastix strix]